MNLGETVPKHFPAILNGFSVFIVKIHGKKVYDVAEFMQQR